MQKQILDRPDVITAYGPITAAADNTPAVVDIRGYQNVQVLIGVGIQGVTFTGTDKIEIKMRDGDATVGNHTAVESTDVKIYDIDGVEQAIGASGLVWSLAAAHAAAKWRRIDYYGGQEYLSFLNDFSGTHGTGTPISIVVLGSKGHLQPPLT